MTWSERELEDFVCANPEVLGITNFGLLDRQVTLPNGWIIDILGMDTETGILYVVELKAVHAKENALVQVLSYCTIIDECAGIREDAGETPCKEVPSDFFRGAVAVLVAPSFSDRVIVASQREASRVLLRFANDTFRIQHLNREYVSGLAAKPPGERLQVAWAVQLRQARMIQRRRNAQAGIPNV